MMFLAAVKDDQQEKGHLKLNVFKNLKEVGKFIGPG